MKTIFVCKECDSPNVEAKMWVDLNTGEVYDAISNDPEDTWCRDCHDHTGVNIKEESE